MALLQIDNKARTDNSLPVLRLGFRPFFLLAGGAAVVLLTYWLHLLNGGETPTGYGGVNWHAHEMLFGFAVAVIAGFLLTAAKNWTNLQTLHGPWLAGLALLWLAARLAPLLMLPQWLIALIDLSFLPVLALVLLPPLLRSKQHQQLIFVVILVALFAANLLFHLGYLHPAWQTTGLGIQLAWMTIVLLIVIMGGRVIPFFIERGTGALKKVRQSRVIDIAGMVTLLAWMVAALIAPAHVTVAYLAVLAGSVQLLRWWGWHLRALWRVPMLWILYLGYAWIPLGLFLYADAVFAGGPTSIALHAFTAGTIGMLTVGMMSRVSLGHTGREIAAGPLLITAFVLVTLGSVLRVFGPLLLMRVIEMKYVTMVTSAGVLWALGFLLFLILYLPILMQPRVDGRPG
ncbi:MAG: NnrS family protein [Gammaproteobacteria bacterium]|nr:NnrS family protein [Gammaproteobacteria bacterium]